jgi:hypothetical protein
MKFGNESWLVLFREYIILKLFAVQQQPKVLPSWWQCIFINRSAQLAACHIFAQVKFDDKHLTEEMHLLHVLSSYSS